MILRELVNFYDSLSVRLAENPDLGGPLPPPEWSEESVSLCAELNPDGSVFRLRDMRDPHVVPLADNREKREPRPKRCILPVAPEAAARNSSLVPRLFWDKTECALGAGWDKKSKSIIAPTTEAKGKKNPRQEDIWTVFRDRNRKALHGRGENGIAAAFLRFLDKWRPEDIAALLARSPNVKWDELGGTNLVFQMKGGGEFLHDAPAAKDAFARHCESARGEPDGVCMITGHPAAIPLVHAKVRGIRGGDAFGPGGGRSLVSAEKSNKALSSHGWKQNQNSPVGDAAAFKYVAVLNWLLRTENRRKLQFGDAAVVFWTDNASGAETTVLSLLDDFPSPDAAEESLRDKLNAMRKGKLPDPVAQNPHSQFFVLGLAPNAGRAAVRFFHRSTVGAMRDNIRRHYDDLEIAPDGDDHRPVTPRRMLAAVAPRVNGKPDPDKLPPNFAAELYQSILNGSQYPQTLLAKILQRARAGDKINRDLAAVAKAFLIRNRQTEVPAMLNPNIRDAAYNLGRLLAVVERAQLAAIGKVNRNAAEVYISSLAAAPARVYPRMMATAQRAYLAHEKARWLNKLVDEIHAKLPDAPDEKIPATLSQEKRALFLVGYYEQRADLWKKHDAPEQPDNPQE